MISMDMSMACSAQSCYIKPAFWFITVMVVQVCLVATHTLIVGSWQHSSFSYHYIYSIFCFISLRMYASVYSTLLTCMFSVFRAFVSISFMCQIIQPFRSWLFHIFSMYNFFAQFTVRLQPIWRLLSFVEIRQRFRMLAIRTLLCYNWLRHFRSFQRTCLEPVVGHIPITGLFYYSENKANVNKNNII